MKRCLIFPALLLCALLSHPQAVRAEEAQEAERVHIPYNADFEQAAELFQMNKPREAIPIFEKILSDETVDPLIWVYLGVSYYQIGEYEKSLEVCVEGLTKPSTDHKVLAYNAGNAAFAMGKFARAEACYAIAIKEDSSYAPPVLNTANAQLKQDNIEAARENYILYLSLNPETKQKENIELMIQKLDEEIQWRMSLKPELVAQEPLSEADTSVSREAALEKIDLEILSILNAESPAEQPPAVRDERVSEDNVAPVLPSDAERSDFGERIPLEELEPPEIEAEAPKSSGDRREAERVSGSDSSISDYKPAEAEKPREEKLSGTESNIPSYTPSEKKAPDGEKVSADAPALDPDSSSSERGTDLEPLFEPDDTVFDTK